MIGRNRKLLALALSIILCVALWGCTKEPPVQTTDSNTTATTGKGNSILSTTAPTSASKQYTPVYVSVFGDTALLAPLPMEEWNGEEPDCDPREISQGGYVSCNGEHEKEVPITKVIILEDLVPYATNSWFRNLIFLEKIEGLEKLHTEYVTDMNHMFYGCEKLSELEIDDWDVSSVEDMTRMFDGCVALPALPDWYE